jgi:hypothetical protein
MAACDALMFTPGGEQLLAVGDDKCVHLWDVQGNRLRYTDPAWWNSFRERRGSIFALAISPDGERMVVGGFGRLTADVVIFRRRSRLIEAALSAAIQPGYAQASSTVWALAFHPTLPRVAVGQGDRSGSGIINSRFRPRSGVWQHPWRRAMTSKCPKRGAHLSHLHRVGTSGLPGVGGMYFQCPQMARRSRGGCFLLTARWRRP